MKKFIEFMLFITYTVYIFCIENYYVFLALALLHLLLMFMLKIKIVKALKNIATISLIVVITSIINSIVIDIKTGILIGIKLIMVCNATYIFSQKFNYIDLSKVIEKLFFFMKIFKINPKDIGLIVCITVAFIPILNYEILEIKNSLKSKGYKLKLTNLHLILQPFFTSIFKRITSIEDALIAKGYE